MKRQIKLIVSEFEPFEDREMGTDGGFRVSCEELELVSSAPTLDCAMSFMARMMQQKLTASPHE